MENFERIKNQEQVIAKFEDLRGLDLSERDLRNTPVDVLITANFDTKTKWPEQDRLPEGFNPEKVINEAKNPGLGIRELHQQGIDGRGVRVAIIDQTLSSRQGELVQHSEYAARIIDYKEFGDAKNEDINMHGPAVASLLVGKECGIAPGAELVYRAVPSGRAFNYRADALSDIIEFNKTLPPENKIRIVSCSIGYIEEKSEPGLERWIETIRKAEAEGIIVSDVSDRTGVDSMGGGTSADKNDPENYDIALFLEDQKDKNLINILAECGRNIDLILQKLRETKQDKIAQLSDSILRKKISQILSQREKEVIIPCDYRTMASNTGPNEFMYNGKGGLSWAVPYLTGLFALAFQINPNLTKEEIANAINNTAVKNKKGFKVVNPRGFIDAIRV